MTEVEYMEWIPAINMLAYHAYKAGWYAGKRDLTQSQSEDLLADEIQTELIARVYRGDCG